VSTVHGAATGTVNRTATRSMARFLPSRQDYAGLGKTWRTDLLAGITVGIVALPLALAFGVSSGVGAEAGLITAIVAGLVAAVMGGSPVQVSGPTGAMVVVLAPVVAVHGPASVAPLSLMAGLLVCVLGFSGLGRAVAFIPWPVVEGFTLGSPPSSSSSRFRWLPARPASRDTTPLWPPSKPRQGQKFPPCC
jgi:SulP family sulfate permease